MSDTLQIDFLSAAGYEGFVMSGVTPETAAMQFFVEAMKANTATLERVNSTMTGMQAEQKEQIRLMIDVRERVIKLENNQVGRRLDEIREQIKEESARIKALEEADDKRDGERQAVGTIWKNLPQFVSLFMGLIAIGAIILKLAGRI